MNNIVDVILPNFNKEKFLDQTIKSVINQSLEKWRLIIIDNCSTDNSKNIINKYSSQKKFSTIFLKKNMGVSFSRNLGIRLSQSKYISFIDSDDLWDKNKLRDQINFMEKNSFDFTYTDYTPFFDKQNERYYKKKIIVPEIFNYNDFIFDSSICTSSMILSRKMIKRSKFPKVKTLEDYSFKCELLKTTRAIKFKDSITFYRITKNSLTSNKFKNLYWLWIINKKYNKLNLFKNFLSLLSISISSLKKYGYK